MSFNLKREDKKWSNKKLRKRNPKGFKNYQQRRKAYLNSQKKAQQKKALKIKIQRQANKASRDGKITGKEARNLKQLAKKGKLKTKVVKKSINKSASKRTDKGRATQLAKGTRNVLKINKKRTQVFNKKNDPKGKHTTKPKDDPKPKDNDPKVSDPPPVDPPPVDPPPVDPPPVTPGDIDPTDPTIIDDPDPDDTDPDDTDPIDIDELGIVDPEIDGMPEGNYNKNRRFDQDVLDDSLEAAEDRLNDNLKEWRKTNIDSLRIDSEDALAYRGDAWKSSLAGRYQSKDRQGKADMIHNLKQPIHDQVLKQVNGKDPFNTFVVNNGKIKTSLPKDRGTGMDHSDAYEIAKNLGVPSNKSAKETLKRLSEISEGPSIDYNKRGKDILGIKMPSNSDIRDGMPEPLKMSPTQTTKHRLKDPNRPTTRDQFGQYNLKARANARRLAAPTGN